MERGEKHIQWTEIIRNGIFEKFPGYKRFSRYQESKYKKQSHRSKIKKDSLLSFRVWIPRDNACVPGFNPWHWHLV